MHDGIEFEEKIVIPQNLGYEENLVGPLKKAQVIKLVIPAVAGIGISYALNLPGTLKFAVVGACLLVGAMFAALKVHGAPMEKALANWLSYRARPRQVHAGGQNAGFVDVEEICGPTAKLPGENYARVIEAKGVNFDFMSSAERAVAIGGYAQFLNSIEGGVQVVARPEKFSPKEYLQLVSDRLEDVQGKDACLETALSDYMMFFEDLTKDIIVHRFYVVVYTNLRKEAASLFDDKKIPPMAERIAKADEILELKSGNIASVLGVMNLKAHELDGQELVELLTRYYRGGLE